MCDNEHDEENEEYDDDNDNYFENDAEYGPSDQNSSKDDKDTCDNEHDDDITSKTNTFEGDNCDFSSENSSSDNDVKPKAKNKKAMESLLREQRNHHNITRSMFVMTCLTICSVVTSYRKLLKMSKK